MARRRSRTWVPGGCCADAESQEGHGPTLHLLLAGPSRPADPGSQGQMVPTRSQNGASVFLTRMAWENPEHPNLAFAKKHKDPIIFG